MSDNKERKHINLFEDQDIRCYKVVFNITNEEDLLQWWEYQLENSIEKYQDSITFIHALYRACYRIIEKHNLTFDIIFEKSQEGVYWTIWSKKVFELLKSTCKECKAAECRADEQRISFKISASTCPIRKPSKHIHIEKIPKTVSIYDFLEDDDKEALIEINSELIDELIYLENRGFSERSIDKLQKYLSEYTFILGAYQEIVHIKLSIEELSYFMNENRTTLIELDNSYVSLFEGLIMNLQRWFEALFINGATSIEEYKDSIAADVEIIKTMTIPSSDDAGDFEFF